MVCLLINWFRGSLNLVAAQANSPMDATLEGSAYLHKNLATATTATTTNNIQPRSTRLVTEIPFTRWPFHYQDAIARARYRSRARCHVVASDCGKAAVHNHGRAG